MILRAFRIFLKNALYYVFHHKIKSANKKKSVRVLSGMLQLQVTILGFQVFCFHACLNFLALLGSSAAQVA